MAFGYMKDWATSIRKPKATQHVNVRVLGQRELASMAIAPSTPNAETWATA
jgi:hypothetical protein